MEEILKGLIASSPSAVACIVLVVIFLRQMRERDSQWQEHQRVRSDECHKVTDRATEAMEKCAKSMGESCSTMERSNQMLERINNACVENHERDHPKSNHK